VNRIVSIYLVSVAVVVALLAYGPLVIRQRLLQSLSLWR